MKHLKLYESEKTYKGKKANVPNNISMNCFKEIVDMCGGYTDMIQPIINLVSKKLAAAVKNIAGNG